MLYRIFINNRDIKIKLYIFIINQRLLNHSQIYTISKNTKKFIIHLFSTYYFPL